MLFHSHPSGNRKPITENIRITGRLVEVGNLLDLPVLDHLIIIPDQSYFSFADEGLI
ncbi:JAB domain-containing protein [Pedobacter gandavensis]|uniref:JAB domain-containing protein n=1 Tax=Pedobacter gandavensis TaxID=2679963 RepID=UPI00247A7938|nr:JAB domain-containing protein [Pedobacter gandavensis]WGQ10727.1 JAB domain-containing protein [Pedobacter gandavensis]